MTDWASIIKKIAPTALPSIVNGLAAAMPRCIQIADLTTPLRQEHFLAQLAHESAGFKTTTEYASGKAYEGRKDLGNTQKGDGVRYKGRGLIQITGRSNYNTMSKALGVDFIKEPELAAEFPYAALTAALYWKNHNINRYADRDDIRGVTKVINGGTNGLADRMSYLVKAKNYVPNTLITPVSTVADSSGIDVKKAQKRLSDLSYPLGAIDGKIGALTRSAIRDFQDSMSEPVTGNLDQRTYNILMSDGALKRPVSAEREALTVSDLKDKGSTIVVAADKIKANITTAGAALAGASGVASQINDAASQVQSIKDAVQTGHESVGFFAQHWQLIVIAVLILVVIFCIAKCWQYAGVVEQERLRQAQTGENLRH
jgi:putative chitinase